jgi:hypothetical protein
MNRIAARLSVVSLLVLGTGLAQGAGSSLPNWLVDLMAVRAPQTTVVRDPLYQDQFFLCWQGRNGQKYGMRFAAQTLQDRMQTLSPGQKAPLTTVFVPNRAAWTARDTQVCWGP